MVVEVRFHSCLTSALHGSDSVFPHSGLLYRGRCIPYAMSLNVTPRLAHCLFLSSLYRSDGDTDKGQNIVEKVKYTSIYLYFVKSCVRRSLY
jgi:hypothetical protein